MNTLWPRMCTHIIRLATFLSKEGWNNVETKSMSLWLFLAKALAILVEPKVQPESTLDGMGH